VKDESKLRSPVYLSHVRALPCLISGSESYAVNQTHHLTHVGGIGKGTKTGDQWAVPLNPLLHARLHDWPRGEADFWLFHGVDAVKWAELTYRQWMEARGEG
jgi:hypothetical protein